MNLFDYNINDDALFYSQKGIEFYKKNDFQNAIENFTKAINSHPENQNFYLWRGTGHEDIGNDIMAEIDFKKSLALNPDNHVAAYRLGMVYYRKNDLKSATKWLQKSYENAIKLNNLQFDSTKIFGSDNNLFSVSTKIIANNLGTFLVQLGLFEEGLFYIDKSIEIDNKYHFAYMSKGLAYLQMNLQDIAIPFLIKAKELGNPKADLLLKTIEENNYYNSNPLNISENPELSKYHSIPDITSVFIMELKNCYTIANGNLKRMKEVTEIYAVSTLISYFDNAKIVPMCVVDSILFQILNASNQACKSFNQNLLFQSINELKTNVLKRVYKNSVREDVAVFFG